MSRLAAVLVLVALVAVTGCGTSSAKATDVGTSDKTARTTVWHQLGVWSGRSSGQTASFRSDTGALRVHWETKSPAKVTGDAALFRVTAHSAISGRLLQQVLEQTVVGSGTEYVQQDPNTFYLVVDSSNIEWTVTVEEGIAYP